MRKGGVLKDDIGTAGEGEMTEDADGEVGDVAGRSNVETIEPVNDVQANFGGESESPVEETSLERQKVTKPIAKAEGSNVAADEGINRIDDSSDSEDGGVQLQQPEKD